MRTKTVYVWEQATVVIDARDDDADGQIERLDIDDLDWDETGCKEVACEEGLCHCKRNHYWERDDDGCYQSGCGEYAIGRFLEGTPSVWGVARREEGGEAPKILPDARFKTLMEAKAWAMRQICPEPNGPRECR